MSEPRLARVRRRLRARQAGPLAVVTGLVVGLAVAGFERLAGETMFDRVLDAPLWVQAVAPAVGLAVAAVVLRTLGRGAPPSTADEYIRNFHDSGRGFELRSVPARLGASVATLGSGAAMGFEGPSIYLGAAIGSWIQSRWAGVLRREDDKLLMVCGAAAGVAAIFKAPVTGLVFALEVPYRQDLARRMLLPAMFASAASYVVYVAVNGSEPLFPIGGTAPFDLRDLGGAAALGLLAGLGARVIAWLLRAAKQQAQERSVTVRLAGAGAGLVAVFAATRGLTGESLSIGSGYGAIDWALQPAHAVGTIAAVFLLRMVATTLAVGGGGVGGLFIPLVVQGSLLGAALGAAVQAPSPTFFPLLGVAAFLGAGYRVPLAAVVFVAETTGRPGFVVPGLIAAATSQILMGDSSVTPYQQGARVAPLERRLAQPISAAIQADAATVSSEATLEELFDRHIKRLGLRAVPVADGGAYRGMAHLDDLVSVPRDEWVSTPVARVVRTEDPVAQVSWTLGDAVRTMQAADVDQLPVLDDDAFVGLVTATAILKLDGILDRPDG